MSSTHGYSLRAAILPEPWSLQDPSTIVSVTGSIVCGWYLVSLIHLATIIRQMMQLLRDVLCDKSKFNEVLDAPVKATNTKATRTTTSQQQPLSPLQRDCVRFSRSTTQYYG
jgi:hypothetical protein